MRLEFELNNYNTKQPKLSWSFSAFSQGHYSSYVEVFKGKVKNLPNSKQALVRSAESADHFKVEFNSAAEVLRALIVCLDQIDSSRSADINLWINDQRYQQFSEHVLELIQVYYSKKETKDDVSDQIDSNLIEQCKVVLLKKNKQLLSKNNTLQDLCSKLSLPAPMALSANSDSSIKAIVSSNESLMRENEKLYRNIVLAARTQATAYNKDAIKAIIASGAVYQIQTQEPALLNEAQKSYQDHHSPKKEEKVEVDSETLVPLKNMRTIAVEPQKMPTYGQVYPYVEEDIFKLPEEDREQFPKEYSAAIQVYKPVSNQNVILNIPDTALKALSEKVGKVTKLKQETKEDLAWYEYFFNILYEFFLSIYEAIREKLSSAAATSDPLTHNGILAQNIDNILNNKEVTDAAKILHRFNSAKSPLIAVIYAKDLSIEQKLELLDKLSQCTSYCSTNPAIKNINIADKEQIGGSSENTVASPLHHAVVEGSAEMVAILLKHKPQDINSNQGWFNRKVEQYGFYSMIYCTPLHLAVAKNDLKMVELLLTHGADINIPDEHGKSPIFYAKSAEMYKLLIAKKADVNQKIIDSRFNGCSYGEFVGQTPLHFAVKDNNLDWVRELLEHKADPSITDVNGDSALHWASAKMFEPAQPIGWYSYWKNSDAKNAKANNVQIIQNIVEASTARSSNVNQSNNLGYNCLMAAVLGQRNGDHDATSISHSRRSYSHLLDQVKVLSDAINPSEVMNLEERYSSKLSPTNVLFELYNQQNGFFCDPATSEFESRAAVAKILIDRGARLTSTQLAKVSEICKKQKDEFSPKLFDEMVAPVSSVSSSFTLTSTS